MLRRLDSLVATDAFEPSQRAAIRSSYETVKPFCLVNGARIDIDDDFVNHDLTPRDEYFLNDAALPAPSFPVPRRVVIEGVYDAER